MTLEAALKQKEPLLRRIVGQMRVPGWDLEDLVQEGRLAYWEAMQSWDGTRGCSAHTWFVIKFRQRLHALCAHATRQKHTPLNGALPLVDGPDDGAVPREQLADPTAPDEETMTRRVLLSQILARANLTEKEEVVVMFRLIGLENRDVEIARGWTRCQVQAAWQRAQEKIRRKAAVVGWEP